VELGKCLLVHGPQRIPVTQRPLPRRASRAAWGFTGERKPLREFGNERPSSASSAGPISMADLPGSDGPWPWQR